MSIREDGMNGTLNTVFRKCAENEVLSAAELMKGVAGGTIAIPGNIHHDLSKVIAIGKNTRTKINANIGLSINTTGFEDELLQLKVAVDAGADMVTDLSMGNNLDEMRRTLLENCPVPYGTVPIYQAGAEAVENRKGDIADMTVDGMFKAVEKQAGDGVDFMTVHCGINNQLGQWLDMHKGPPGVVSRSGLFTLEWMRYNKKENPFYEHFDDLLALLKEYEVVLILGDGFWPRCLDDETGRDQIDEITSLGELTQRAWDAGVQVIIEGSGHMPLDQIAEYVLKRKKMCKEAPLYVSGLLVTGLAPGYDHITGAIGGSVAASAGADCLCCLTDQYHFDFSECSDIRQGVIASQIAAHAADIVKKVPESIDLDNAMADARNRLNWKQQIDLAIDPFKILKMRESGGRRKTLSF